MKTHRLLALIISAWGASLLAQTVTLQINGNPSQGTIILTNSVSIAANQVATILARDGSANAFWTKDGITNSFALEQQNYTGGTLLPPLVISGPATISLYTQAVNNGSGFCTVQIDPQAFPPGQTLVIPAGSGALISLEASPDLKYWTNAVPGLYTNQVGNLFFRIAAQRTP